MYTPKQKRTACISGVFLKTLEVAAGSSPCEQVRVLSNYFQAMILLACLEYLTPETGGHIAASILFLAFTGHS